ncbi:GrpB family protein [Paucisalibacillus sp. EB02]|uniref:GrpB family protein n=1 Tax=Paucisalibacillus sp. EB02 TaxID=1347087 RepID=UPI0004B3C9D6|nr:GrpB family protein [Paucisalibacillus sp. EB02]
MRQITVTPYNQEWIKQFQLEALKLKEIFGHEIVEVFHIGSTAVPGLSAKPIIDMMPVVYDITRIDNYDEEMIKIGFKPKGENGIQGRRYFQKGGDQRTHHVHVYGKGNKEIIRHLAFRNYLREHPEDAKRYGSLKEQLAIRFPFDIESYISGKHDLALEIDKKALLWYRKGDLLHD